MDLAKKILIWSLLASGGCSLTSLVKENIVKSVAPEIQRMMESVIDSKKTYGVTCVADISVGQNWGELKQFKI